jgi:anti-sigma factor RsiW
MKQDHSSASRIDHEEANILLPWYANGTLTESEQLKVSSHLALCPACRHALAEFQRVQVRWQHQTVPALEIESGLARLMATIDRVDPVEAAGDPGADKVRRAGLAKPTSPVSGTGRRFLSWLSAATESRRFGLALASVTGAALIALVSIRSWTGFESSAFRTLGRSEPTEYAARNDLRVVFTPSASIQQVIETVASVHGRIVDGPTQPGVFTIRIEAAAGDGASPVPQILEQLRRSPVIVLAQPAAPLAPSVH